MLISLDKDRNVACSFRFFDWRISPVKPLGRLHKQGSAIRQPIRQFSSRRVNPYGPHVQQLIGAWKQYLAG